MKLLGRDIDARELLRAARARLEARGIRERAVEPGENGPQPLVEPLSFGVQSLEQNEDPTLPLAVEESGPSPLMAAAVARRLFRRLGQVFIDEALGRQRVFNGRVKDLNAQLAAEVLRLRARVEALESAGVKRPELPARTAKGRGAASGKKAPGKRTGPKRSPRR